VDRREAEELGGYRVLARDVGPPPVAVVRAAGTVRVVPDASGLWATVSSRADLVVRANSEVRWLGLEVPMVVEPPIASQANFDEQWAVQAIELIDGAPLSYTVTGVEREPGLIALTDRRTALVDLPLDAGDQRTLRVSWSQRVPYARMDTLPTRTVQAGTSTTLLPALPRLAGDRSPFPYQLAVAAPSREAIVVSGHTVSEEVRGGYRVVESSGESGAQAAVAVGRWREGGAAGVRLLVDRASSADAENLARLDGPLRAWSGRSLPEELDVVQLPAAFRLPVARWAEGIAAVRPAMTLVDVLAYQQSEVVANLPRLEMVLLSEAVAAATFADRAVDVESEVWVTALARAFAMDLLAALDADAARVWRAELRRCAYTSERRPALSAQLTATSGYRDVAARCAVPLIAGPMLTDRLGTEAAVRVRHDLLAGALDAATFRSAVLAADPTAGPWVARWLGDGHLAAPLTARFELSDTPEGVVASGSLRTDASLGGAPVVLRFRRGEQTVDEVVEVHTADRPFSATLPFRPLSVDVDPELRLLQGHPPRTARASIVDG
jgi:hypothetical protein